MQKQTDTQNNATMEDLYNLLMSRIEPELCTYNIDLLDGIYKKESKKSRKERLKHYVRCLDLFWDALRELVDLTKADLKEFKEVFLDELKKKALKDDKKGISDIEKSISESE